MLLSNYVTLSSSAKPGWQWCTRPTCDTTIHRRPLCLPAPSASLLRLPLVLSPSAPLFFQRAHASLRSLHSHAHCQLLGLPSLYLRVASAKVPVRVKFCACGCCLFFSPFFLTRPQPTVPCPRKSQRSWCMRRKLRPRANQIF